MPVLNRIAGFAEEMTAWRRHLHQNPELGLDCHNTAAFVVEQLTSFGVDHIETGWATSGVVAVIKGQGDGPVTGLRADMDALPMQEDTGADWASTIPGRMHACGHDGHTTMLLGAAKYLAETRNFRGTAVLIFQPAEEIIGGAQIMVQDGLMDKFGIDEVYALHTDPFAEAGLLRTTPGEIMAAVDDWVLTFTGKGGHAAYPETTVDPIPAALAAGQAILAIPSRSVSALDRAVVSLTQVHSGSAFNIIPETAQLVGTVRSFSAPVQDLIERRFHEIAGGIATAYGLSYDLKYTRDYPATINHAPQTDFAVRVAQEVVGKAQVVDTLAPEMGAEDFSFMLQHRPGCFLFLGQGVGASVHHPKFDFNDAVAPIGASFFARLVEQRGAV